MKYSLMFLLLFTFESYKSACGNGTLQCSPDNFPLVCDFSKSMILNEEGTECIVQKIDGCLLPAFSSSSSPCFKCEAGKVLDTDKTKCIDVLTDRLVENCKDYDRLNSSCLSCIENYYLYQAKCISVGDNIVENCVAYNSEGKCETCKFNYYLRENSCFEFESAENCFINTNRRCISCGDDYILNYANNPVLSVSSDLKLKLLLSVDSGAILQDSNNFDSCQKVSVTNCAILEDFNNCKECVPGYFLRPDKKCELFPEQEIFFCEIYLTGTSCQKCNDLYFKTDSTCSPVTQKENCVEYSQASGKCSLCTEDYYLPNPNAHNPCLSRNFKDIEKCDKNNSFADECLECSSGYTLTQDNQACLANIADCLDGQQVPAILRTNFFHTCNQCTSGKYFNTQNGLCEDLTTIDGCLTYELQANLCSTCQSGKYISVDQSSCTDKEITNCVNYVTSDDNLCTLCESLFYLSEDSTQCVALANTSICYLSHGLIDQCEVCQPGYYKSGTNCVSANTRPATQYDKNCVANQATTNDDGCDICTDNFIKSSGLSNAFKTESEMTSLNCEKIKSDGTCDICLENFYNNATSGCSSSTIQDSEQYCVQHVAGSNEDLDVPGNCLKCKSDVPLMMNDKTCEIQDEISSILGCGDTSYGQNLPCSSCSDTLFKIKYDAQFCSPLTNDPSGNVIFQVVEKCIVHESSGICKICETGTNLSDDKSACEDETVTPMIERGFDINLNPIGHLVEDGFTPVDNCETYIQYSEGKIACGACSANHVAIVEIKGTTSSFNLIANPGSEDHTSWNEILKCEPEANSFKVAADTNASEAGDCAIGFKVSSKSGYGCYKCAGLKSGYWKSLTLDSDDATFDTPVFGIATCSDITNAESKGQGIGYKYRNVIVSLQQNNFITPITCQDTIPPSPPPPEEGGGTNPRGTGAKTANRVFNNTDPDPDPEPDPEPEPIPNSAIYLATNDSSNGVLTPVSVETTTDGTGPLQILSCINTSSMENQIQNCQIYVLDDGHEAVTEFVDGTTTLTNVCLECSPGFKLKDDGTCEEIDSTTLCNTTGDNNWLSACQVPLNESWKSEIVGGATIPMYDSPNLASDNPASNCLLTKSDDVTKCLVCKAGYWLKDDETCHLLVAENELCLNLGIGKSAIGNPSTAADKNLQFVANIQLRLKVEDTSSYSTYVVNYCQTCQADHVLVEGTFDQIYRCGKSDIHPEFSITQDNCEIVKIDNTDAVTGCQKCSSDYLRLADDETCHAKADYMNCAEISEGPVCTKCEDGYLLTSSNTCLKHNCEEFDDKLTNIVEGDTCLVCDDGYRLMPDGDSHKIDQCQVVPSEEESETCSKYSPSLGHCIKCKEAGKIITFIYKVTADTTEFFKYYCLTFDLTGNGYSGVHLSYPYIMYKTNGSGGVHELKYLANNQSAITTITGSLGAPASELCLPKIVVENCETYTDDIICSKCDSTYFLDTQNNECKQSTISDCIDVMDDDSGCNTCMSTHYYNASGPACILRDKSAQNCVTRSDTLDECLTCDTLTRYLDGGECLVGTRSNCVDYYLTSNSCNTCEPNYFKTFNVTFNIYECIEYTITLCGDLKHPYLDQCLNCQEIYWERTIQGETIDFNYKKCELYSVTNCKEKDRSKDSCLECKQGYQIQPHPSISDLFICDPVTPVERCSLYSVVNGLCTTCENGFYLYAANNECRYYPDGLPNCRLYSDRVTCVECMSGYYLNENQCEQITLSSPISDCFTYSSATECSQCDPSKNLILIENECLIVLAENCATLENRSKCDTCIDNHFFNSSTGSCKSSGISNCKLAVAGPVNALCNECQKGYLLNDAKTECNQPETLIDNCLDYENQTKCRECNEGYYLLHNKSACYALDNKFGNECTKGEQTKLYICDICKYGYIKDIEGNCVENSDKGCAVTDVSTNKCLLCLPGESMDSSGDCTDPDAVQEDSDLSSKLMSFSSIVLLLLIYLKFD